MGSDPRVEASACQVVRRRPAQRRGQLRGAASQRPDPEQGGADLGGRAGRPPGAHLLGSRPRGPEAAPTRSSGWASRKGDRVAIYLPMVPEAVDRHARVRADRRRPLGRLRRLLGRGGPRPDQRRRRPRCSSRRTADYRRGQVVPLKRLADEAIERHAVHRTLPRRCGACGHRSGRVRSPTWSKAGTTGGTAMVEAESAECAAEPMDAEDMLFILYTSGTTGKPKGIVHTTGGYLTQVAATTKYVFDLKPEDVFWCTADIGLGDRAHVRGLRAAGQRRDGGHVRGGARLARSADRFWELIETLRGDGPLHRADRDPRVHEVGHGASGPARSLHASGCSARWASRSTRKRGSWYHDAHRRRPLPDRGYLVADGDRRDHDHARCPASPPPSRVGHDAVPRDRGRAGGRHGQADDRRRRLPRLSTEPWPGMLRTIYGDDRALPARPTGAASRDATSRATARSWTRTATGGSWAGWTTC